MFRSKFTSLAAIAGAALFCATSAQAITFTPPPDAPLLDGVWSVLDIRNNGGIGNQDQARNSLNNGLGDRVLATANVINYLGSGGNGMFGNDNPFPQGDGDNITILARATVFAPVSGLYTLNVNSDDGFTLAVNNGSTAFQAGTVYGGGTILDSYNGTSNGALTFFGGRGTDNSGAVIFLEKGGHVVDLTFHEGGGGSALEFSAALGAQTGFNNQFRLVDNTPNFIPNAVIIPGISGLIEVERVNGLPAQNISSAKAHIANNVGFTEFASVINHRDPDNGVCCGGFDNGAMIPFPGDVPGVNDDNFATQFRGVLDMPFAGEVIIHVQSDDGFSFQIDNAQWEIISSANLGATTVQNNGQELVADFGTGNSDVVARLLLGAGLHDFALTHWDGGGGSYMQVFVGIENGLNGGFLLGSLPASVENILQLSLVNVIPEPASALLGLMGLAALGMRRRRQQA